MTVWTASAPGRCGIAGNPTDMYGGTVLSCSTAERADCRIESGDAGITAENGAARAHMLRKGDFAFTGDNLDILRAALAHFELDPAVCNLHVTLSTQIPMRAGLAGSTAMLAAITGALDSVLERRMHPWALAETVRAIEANRMGVVCGFQDQHMTVFGGLNFMSFTGKESLMQLPGEPYAVVEPLAGHVSQLPLLLAHTGVQHHSGTVHSTPRQRWESGDAQVRDTYRTVGTLGWRAKRALLDRDWPALGEIMNENHALVSSLGGSGAANDRLIAAAREGGALGAKLAGAGGGGTIISLTLDPRRTGEVLLEAGADSLYVPVPSPGLTVSQS